MNHSIISSFDDILSFFSSSYCRSYPGSFHGPQRPGPRPGESRNFANQASPNKIKEQ